VTPRYRRGGRGRAGRRGPTAWRHAGVFALALVLGVATALWAHGALKRADPGDRQRVPSPTRLRLEFNERVELHGVVIALTDARGVAASLGTPAHAGTAKDSLSIVVVPVLAPLAPGAYRVAWQIVGRDGHPVRGRYGFEVVPSPDSANRAAGGSQQPGTADSAGARVIASAPSDTGAAHGDHVAPPSTPADTIAVDAFDVESNGYVALRWLSYIMLLAAIGAVVIARVTDRAATVGARHAVQSRLAGVGLAAAWLGVALALARLLAQSWAVHGAGRALSPMLLGPLVGSAWGRAWAVQLVAAMIAVAGYTLALHDARRSGGWRIAIFGGVLAAAGSAFGGHAAAVEGWTRPLIIAADFLHILAAGAWIGGVMMLAVAVLPRADAPAAANVVRAFSPWALGGFATLAITGAVAAWTHLEHPLAPWESRYGRVLLLKLAFVAIVLLLGALNWQRLGPASSTASGNTALRRSVWLEVLMALGILAVTALLVAVPPTP
jgi:copper transport protein